MSAVAPLLVDAGRALRSRRASSSSSPPAACARPSCPTAPTSSTRAASRACSRRRRARTGSAPTIAAATSPRAWSTARASPSSSARSPSRSTSSSACSSASPPRSAGASTSLLGRVVEVGLLFPTLLLLLAIQGVTSSTSLAEVALAIALTQWPYVARLTRAEALRVADAAARRGGARRRRRPRADPGRAHPAARRHAGADRGRVRHRPRGALRDRADVPRIRSAATDGELGRAVWRRRRRRDCGRGCSGRRRSPSLPSSSPATSSATACARRWARERIAGERTGWSLITPESSRDRRAAAAAARRAPRRACGARARRCRRGAGRAGVRSLAVRHRAACVGAWRRRQSNRHASSCPARFRDFARAPPAMAIEAAGARRRR